MQVWDEEFPNDAGARQAELLALVAPDESVTEIIIDEEGEERHFQGLRQRAEEREGRVGHPALHLAQHALAHADGFSDVGQAQMAPLPELPQLHADAGIDLLVNYHP